MALELHRVCRRHHVPSARAPAQLQTLRSPEREGLITRTATLDVPVRVEYSLTEMGRGFLALLFRFRDWAESNIGRVDEARARYDATAGTA
jgi:DNA-binding HxlR family transcriptional regulator